MSLTVITFFSSLASPCLIDTHTAKLRESGARIVTPEEYKKEFTEASTFRGRNAIFFIGTGGTEKQVADLVNQINIEHPIILFSHQANNSLPASMEIRSYLERRGLEAIILHHSLQSLIDTLSRWMQFEDYLDSIRHSRLGLIGSPSFWLIASHVDRKSVTEKWGLNILDYDLDELKTLSKIDGSLSKEFLANASKTEIPEDEVEKAATIARRLEEFMESEELNAVTVQCFDLLKDTSVSGCLALSHINNTPGRIAGCEGDVPSTFTMILARLLTGSPSFMANVTDVDIESNSVVFAHCTVATSLVNSYDITTHYETGMSVGIRGSFEMQKVTVFKVSGDDLLDYWVSSGTLLENIQSEDGCRTQIRVELDSDVAYFLDSSLANHHIVIPGDHVQLIEDFFSYFLLRE